MILNGAHLAVNPPPQFFAYHLLVPVRRIIEALGLQFEKSGRHVTTYAGAKRITLTIGSARAMVDDVPVYLDAPPIEIHNTLYAPLRFFTEALGAQASFERQTNSVVIASALLGRTGSVTLQDGRGAQAHGTITAMDFDSSPATLTLTYVASVRTLPVNSDARVIVEDVSSGTADMGDLTDIHVGDWADVSLDRSGRIKQIIDAYGSRSGAIAAAASGQIVLADGHVIQPSRATTITLNGSAVTIDRLAVGDTVTVRYNIDTSEPREILATRPSATTTAAGPVAISAIDISPDRPLRKGATLSVTLRGTPGGTASYDIGPYVTSLPLKEATPGVYTGSYTVRESVNIAGAPIFGHLNVRGTAAPQAQSGRLVSISTEPPGIVDFAPDNGATINNPRPSIYATFSSPIVGVNPSSIRLEVNGHDVTSSATRTFRFIDYMAPVDYRDGPVQVIVQVADQAGNRTVKRWTFFIRTR
ncbi:MAG TPA: copper amine oxidase N-terminal domain-containing protein [Candidatus Rubrimentiphilum sp.]|nr:copper amine oxidase N-terminal domain-containing protein [Candidatus Rubrimentiphilum sp.]